MRWSDAGLKKVVCVSEAVRQACLEAGYKKHKLAVVHNGLPPSPAPQPLPQSETRVFRLGYLGLFSERKGLRTLFEALEELARLTPLPWHLALAGDAQEEEGRQLVARLKETFSSRPWWPRIEWCGWVKHPAQFLASVELLVCPSSDFDPFPTVVLEAAQAGVPVLGARVGGIPEMIEEGKTGWLFDRNNPQEAARRLQEVLQCPDLAVAAGGEAKKRVEGEFTIHRMVQDYLNVYAGLPVI
jgi:glycosyltransferase involved in cell wall biosynthesis